MPKSLGRVLHISDEKFEELQRLNPGVGVISSLPLQMQTGVSEVTDETPHNKWGNKPTDVDGYRFPSKLEANRYNQLKEWQAIGVISGLSVQYDNRPKHTWVLKDGFYLPSGKRVRAINYVDDFQYVTEPDGVFVVEDTKGKETDVFKMKWKMFKERYPHIHFFINHSVRGMYRADSI